MKILKLLLPLFLCSILNAVGQVTFENAQTRALIEVDNLKLFKNSSRNIYYDKEDVIHVFMFEDGNVLLSGYPTTATEKNKYKLHLYYDKGKESTFKLEVVGTYEPVLNIQHGNAIPQLAPELSSFDFAVLGPYTNSVTFTLKKRTTDTEFTVINSTTVKISKTIHASIGTGLLYSTLKNPTNIRTVPSNDNSGGSTLLADNPNGGATLALMATLYPWGRNDLMIPSKKMRDKLGIVVGTTIASSEKNFKNLYFGLQMDFAIGGSLIAGADIADRQKIRGVNYRDFEFGKTSFTGEVDDNLYKKVGVGFFIGVQVDSRIFAKLFASNP